MSKQHVQKLSAIKQRQSLGEVKKAEKEKAKAANTRKVIRTTVVNSCEYDWPSISEGGEKELLDRLTTDLVCLRLPDCKIPLSAIRKTKKDSKERREFRHKWFTQKYLELGFNFSAYSKLREDILLGVNEISRATEQRLVKCIIIEKDVDPPYLTQLLVGLANSRGIPVVAIAGLNKTCQETFKTRCIAMGLKENCSDSNHSLNSIFRLVLSLSEKRQSLEKEKQSSSSTSTVGGNNSKSEYFKPPKIRRV